MRTGLMSFQVTPPSRVARNSARTQHTTIDSIRKRECDDFAFETLRSWRICRARDGHQHSPCWVMALDVTADGLIGNLYFPTNPDKLPH